jgi:hypothetical protein
MFRAGSCVCLELRSLPSTRVTRFPRYYEPLRHPRAPGLSLAGVQLVLSSLTRPRFGTSRVACAFLVYVLPPLPRCSGWASSSHLTRPYQPSPITLSGRPAARTLARSPICDQLHRRLQPFCHLHDCSGSFRLERLPGGACTHWKAPPCHGAHVKRPLRVAQWTSLLEAVVRDCRRPSALFAHDAPLFLQQRAS